MKYDDKFIKKIGRPSLFDDAMATKICAHLADGESLRVVCQRPGMPHISTVMRWAADDRYKAFREQYARAREVGLELMADEILAIADETERDDIVTHDGSTKANNEWIQRSRLRVDARKWILSKQLPKKYGERTTLAGDADNPLMPAIDDIERATRLQAILAVAHARQLKEEEDDDSSRV